MTYGSNGKLILTSFSPRKSSFLKKDYTQRSPTIQTVQVCKTTGESLEAPTALPLKWLTKKPMWVKQWPLAEHKLQPLEHMVQE